MPQYIMQYLKMLEITARNKHNDCSFLEVFLGNAHVFAMRNKLQTINEWYILNVEH